MWGIACLVLKFTAIVSVSPCDLCVVFAAAKRNGNCFQTTWAALVLPTLNWTVTGFIGVQVRPIVVVKLHPYNSSWFFFAMEPKIFNNSSCTIGNGIFCSSKYYLWRFLLFLLQSVWDLKYAVYFFSQLWWICINYSILCFDICSSYWWKHYELLHWSQLL